VILENESQVSLQVAALGGSVGTPAQGITAQVIEVQSLQEAQKLGARARGKIIFYNRPLAPSPVDPFEAYSGAIDQRISGAIVAAKMGAAASIIRSLSTLPDDDHPHTGSMGYSHSVTKIPAAALSTHGANQLSSLLKKSPDLKLRLQLSAQRLPSVESYNVMAEITGSEYPNQIVLVGGHLDSWDLSPGAHDNGTGVAHSIEVLRAIQAAGTRLNFKPKRTIRAVLFMSEEWGGIGSEEYARQAQSSGERHIAAIESDRGGFAPVGFSVGKENKGASRLVERFKSWNAFLSHTRGSKTVLGFSGTDVEPLAKLGCATIGFLPEATHYFDLHHSALDQLGAVQASDLSEGAAAMASLAYLISEYGL
jgi:Zn-dependent M28 family amino/carboxypeptidase